MRLNSYVSQLPYMVLNWVLPPACAKCGVQSMQAGALCPECWREMPETPPYTCILCGTAIDAGMHCAACEKDPPPWQAGGAAYPYAGAARSMVLGFKHSGREHMAPMMANLMMRSHMPLVQASDYIVPVPLHFKRLLQRRYNQAGLLAEEIARKSGKPALLDALKRTRQSEFVKDRDSDIRQSRVAGAMSVREKYLDRLSGRSVLIIDDVMTSGASLKEAHRALILGGIQESRVLVFARAG